MRTVHTEVNSTLLAGATKKPFIMIEYVNTEKPPSLSQPELRLNFGVEIRTKSETCSLVDETPFFSSMISPLSGGL